MKKGVAIIIVILIFLCAISYAFPDDAIRVDHDVVNVETSGDLQQFDPVYYKTMNVTYDIIRMTVKNYFTENTLYKFGVRVDYPSHDPMADSCPKYSNKFCFANDTVIITAPDDKSIMGQSFDQMLIEFAVRNDAKPGRYYVHLDAFADNAIYSSENLTLNIGEENFVYGKTVTKEEKNKALPLLVLFGFLMAMLVFGFVLIGKGRGGY